MSADPSTANATLGKGIKASIHSTTERSRRSPNGLPCDWRINASEKRSSTDTTDSETPPIPTAKRGLSRLRNRFCILAPFLWNLIVAIDATAVAVALPTIAQELNATADVIYWTGTAFVLCSAIFQPVIVSLASIFGRVKMIALSLSLFLCGVLVAGCAHNVGMLIAGRSIQGAGGGGLLTLNYVILTDTFALEKRVKFYGSVGLIWLIGTICGPVIGGGFAEHASWRWIFWFSIPVVALCFPSLLLLKEDKHSESKIWARLKQVDWIGAALFAFSLTLVLVPLSWGGITYAWNGWQTLLPLVLGCCGVVVWLAYSYCISPNPLIPLVVINERTALISYFNTVLHGIIFFGLTYFHPLYYQAVKSYSPLISGLAIFPQCVISGISTLVVSTVIKKTHLTKPFAIIGWINLLLGLALLQMLKPSTTAYGWIVLNIPSSMGLGILFAAISMATQASAEHRARCSTEELTKIKATAVGLNPFFRTLGQAFGVAIGQTTFLNRLGRKMGAAFLGQTALLVPRLGMLPADNPLSVELISSILDALRVIWWVLLAVAFLGFVLTLFTKDFGLGSEEIVGTLKPSEVEV